MPTELLNQLAQNSILALLLVLALWALLNKDKEVRQAKQDFIDYLLAKGEKDGELKNQLLTFMQTMTNMMSQPKS